MTTVSTHAARRAIREMWWAVVPTLWLAAVLVTATVCRPSPGSGLVAPVVVVVAVAVVVLVGRPVGAVLVLFHTGLFAMFTWGEVGGLVLLASTVVALRMLPLPIVPTNPTERTDQDDHQEAGV
ncbi:hypothetical protein AB0K21_22240 [Streptosporangium sp. NPDC049248]|uniref:hypothetical protein n=1 Tax=Streptosporangium sp. NPDC049248 TaxID=3155651 RepID=UPI003422B645